MFSLHAVPTNQVCILHARKKVAYNATSQQDVLSKLYTTIYSCKYFNASNMYTIHSIAREMIVKIYYERRKKRSLWIFLIFCWKSKYFLSSKIHNAFSHSQLFVLSIYLLKTLNSFPGFQLYLFPLSLHLIPEGIAGPCTTLGWALMVHALIIYPIHLS